MTHDNPENQPSVELISANTTQTSQERSQETREDDPNNATIVEGVTPLSDFKSLPLHWLWPGHILRGKLTILEGDPGLGKSLFTLDLASRVTWPADARWLSRHTGQCRPHRPRRCRQRCHQTPRRGRRWRSLTHSSHPLCSQTQPYNGQRRHFRLHPAGTPPHPGRSYQKYTRRPRHH